jgi:acyl-CoA thioesterase
MKMECIFIDMDFEKIEKIKELVKSTPYYKFLGIKVIELNKGFSHLQLDFRDELTNIRGVVHGGAIASLADSAGALASVLLLGEGEFITTVELKINYLIPFKKEKIDAFGKLIYKGSRIAVSEVDLKDKEKNLIAKAIVTLSIINQNIL